MAKVNTVTVGVQDSYNANRKEFRRFKQECQEESQILLATANSTSGKGNNMPINPNMLNVDKQMNDASNASLKYKFAMEQQKYLKEVEKGSDEIKACLKKASRNLNEGLNFKHANVENTDPNVRFTRINVTPGPKTPNLDFQLTVQQHATGASYTTNNDFWRDDRQSKEVNIKFTKGDKDFGFKIEEGKTATQVVLDINKELIEHGVKDVRAVYLSDYKDKDNDNDYPVIKIYSEATGETRGDFGFTAQVEGQECVTKLDAQNAQITYDIEVDVLRDGQEKYHKINLSSESNSFTYASVTKDVGGRAEFWPEGMEVDISQAKKGEQADVKISEGSNDDKKDVIFSFANDVLAPMINEINANQDFVKSALAEMKEMKSLVEKERGSYKFAGLDIYSVENAMKDSLLDPSFIFEGEFSLDSFGIMDGSNGELYLDKARLAETLMRDPESLKKLQGLIGQVERKLDNKNELKSIIESKKGAISELGEKSKKAWDHLQKTKRERQLAFQSMMMKMQQMNMMMENMMNMIQG